MVQNCKEQVLKDVVRVMLVPASVCEMAVPFMVPGITSMAGTKTVDNTTTDRIGAAALTLALAPSEAVDSTDDAEMDDSPVLKQQDSRGTSGIAVKHELSIGIRDGFDAVASAINSLSYIDFHVVLITDDGAKYLLYSVPNGSQASFSETGIGQEGTLKIEVESCSHVIGLVY